MESRGRGEVGEPQGGAPRAGVACRGGSRGRRGGPLPLPVPVPRPRGRVPSYQVTAGFASFSLARPQPIRAQRRCSRAGGLETRAPSRDTGAARRRHPTAVALTRAHRPRDTPRRPPPHAMTVTCTPSPKRADTASLTQILGSPGTQHCLDSQPRRHAALPYTTARTFSIAEKQCLDDLVPRTQDQQHALSQQHTQSQ